MLQNLATETSRGDSSGPVLNSILHSHTNSNPSYIGKKLQLIWKYDRLNPFSTMTNFPTLKCIQINVYCMHGIFHVKYICCGKVYQD